MEVREERVKSEEDSELDLGLDGVKGGVEVGLKVPDEVVTKPDMYVLDLAAVTVIGTVRLREARFDFLVNARANHELERVGDALVGVSGGLEKVSGMSGTGREVSVRWEVCVINLQAAVSLG
jgi:hypothetical protein